MKIEIELPKGLEKYKEDVINYALEAIEIKKTDDDYTKERGAVRKKAKKEIDKVKINGKTVKKRRKEREREERGREERQRETL